MVKNRSKRGENKKIMNMIESKDPENISVFLSKNHI